jgi:hypothetical protein
MFVVMASEIVTLNLNYVDPESLKKKPSLVTQANAGRALAAAERASAAAQRRRRTSER